MHVSSGRPSMLMSNQRGRGNEPVVVLGRIRSAVAVNIGASSQKLRLDWVCNFVGFRFSVVQFPICGGNAGRFPSPNTHCLLARSDSIRCLLHSPPPRTAFSRDPHLLQTKHDSPFPETNPCNVWSECVPDSSRSE